MSIRRRLVALFAAIAVIAGIAVATSLAAIWVSDHATVRLAGISQRLDTLDLVEARAGDYLAAAGRFASGDSTADDSLRTTKVELERLLVRLTQVTRDEIASLGAVAEIEKQLPEIDASRRLLELFHAVDAAMNGVRSLRSVGDTATASQSFARDVAFRLTNEFMPLLVANAAGERQESGEAISARNTALMQVLIIGGLMAGAATLAAVFSGVALYRRILGAMASLQAHARAVSSGEPEPASADLPLELESVDASLTALAAAASRRQSESAGQSERLHEANRQLRELDRRRGQFLADVSHELRTPLTILRGEADVGLRGQSGPEALRASLERIQGQASELGLLLDDLLEFARTAQDDQRFEPAPTSLIELVTAAAQEGEMLAASREMTLTSELPPADSTIDADFRRLKQALVIGLDNAVKQSPPGSTMSLSARIEDGHAAIAILDNGSGVAEADLPRVFDRFYRGHGADGSMRDGIGIGLAIAKEIVELHGGTITLANRPEGGAVLRISLPLTMGEPA